MTAQEGAIGRHYASALGEYLSEGDELSLERAYQLGRSATTRGLGLLEVASVHRETVASLLSGASSPEEAAEIFLQASQFLMEVLALFEMTHRGFREANRTLRRLNETLDRRAEELLRANAAIERERATLAAIMGSTSDGFLLLDLEGKVVYGNSQLGRMLGLDLREAQDRPAIEVLFQGGPAGFEAPEKAARGWSEALQDTQARPRLELRIGGPPPREVRCDLFPVAGHDGQAVGAGAVFRDVTAERELERAARREQQSTTIRTLASRFAHEILNPLGAMLNGTYLVRSRLAERRPVELAHVRAIEREGMRIQLLVRDLLAYTEPPRPQWAALDLTHLVAELVEELELPPTQEGVLSLDPVPSLVADEVQIRQALRNVVINASEAMPEGGKLAIRCFASTEATVIEVTDTGPGIPPEIRQRIFEPLFTTKSAGGFGLGLPAARAVVEAHGGTIELESTTGKGSTFRILLPSRRRPD